MLKGSLISITASILFGVLYYLSTRLAPLSSEGIFGFRIWVSLPFIIFSLFLFKKTGEFKQFLQQLKQSKKLQMVIFFTSFITAVQMWLFLWGPNNNAGIDVAMGYLLMPIAMVAVGRWVFNERLSLFKILSLLFSILGISGTLIATGSFSWATLLVLTGYPIYFGLRKYFNIAHLSSFACEMILMLPAASYFILKTDLNVVLSQNPNFYLWLALLGVVSGTALICYILASSLVPMNVMGLLSYMEPMSMLLVSFLIGEVLDKNAYFLMICLMIAVGFLMLDGILSLKKQRKRV